MAVENRAFLEMLKPAKERLRSRPVGDIAANTQIEFRRKQQEFYLSGLGREITVSYPSYDVEPSWNEWHVLMLLHYMDMADGTPLSSELITFGELKEGMVRGGGFDRKCENVIRTVIGKKEPEKVRKACTELGAEFIPSKADLCAVFKPFPRYPVTLNIWFADEELEGSGRMLLNANAEHYLSVEDAVTAGELILEELTRRLSS